MARSISTVSLTGCREIDFNCVLKWDLIKSEDRLLIALSNSQRSRLFYCGRFVNCGRSGLSRHRVGIFFPSPPAWSAVKQHIWSRPGACHLSLGVEMRSRGTSHFPPFHQAHGGKRCWTSSSHGRNHSATVGLVQSSLRRGSRHYSCLLPFPLSVTGTVMSPDPLALLGWCQQHRVLWILNAANYKMKGLAL